MYPEEYHSPRFRVCVMVELWATWQQFMNWKPIKNYYCCRCCCCYYHHHHHHQHCIRTAIINVCSDTEHGLCFGRFYCNETNKKQLKVHFCIFWQKIVRFLKPDAWKKTGNYPVFLYHRKPVIPGFKTSWPGHYVSRYVGTVRQPFAVAWHIYPRSARAVSVMARRISAACYPFGREGRRGAIGDGPRFGGATCSAATHLDSTGDDHGFRGGLVFVVGSSWSAYNERIVLVCTYNTNDY